MSRIAVFGASGFVGATLVERLMAQGTHELVPIIRTPGNAWRLARHGLDLRQVDLLTGDGLEAALDGVDFVVNCTRGGKPVMLDGLSNLLRVSAQHRVRKFIHLSSVMIYGDPPYAESEEAAPVRQGADTYGGIKLQQDEMVAAAAAKGLPAVILVPPNISGPYSAYLQGIVAAINAGEFAVMESGESPVNLVDVENLCYAIECAMTRGAEDGSRYLITDDEATLWRDLVHDLLDLRMTQAQVHTVSRDVLTDALAVPSPPKVSVWSSVKHLVSSDIREALRRDPLWRKFDRTIRTGVRRMGSNVEDSLRFSIEGTVKVGKRSDRPKLNWQLCGHQLREGRHSIRKARKELGYEPVASYRQSICNFKRWYRTTHGLDTEFSDLLRHLYG